MGIIKVITSVLGWRTGRWLELENQKHEGYEVKILNRGEEVLYRVGTKSLVVAVTWQNVPKLYLDSIRQRETPIKGERLSQQEFDIAVQRIKNHLESDGNSVELIHPTA